MQQTGAPTNLDLYLAFPKELRECAAKFSVMGIKGDSFIIEFTQRDGKPGLIKSLIRGDRDQDLETLRHLADSAFFDFDEVTARYVTNKLVEVIASHYSNGAAHTIWKIKKKAERKDAELDGQDDNEKGSRDKYRHATVMKYSALRDPGDDITPVLFECVKIAGVPYFVSFHKDGMLRAAKEQIEDDANGYLLDPYKGSAYEAYAFSDVEELQQYVDEALAEDLDSLWAKVHAWVADCVDTDEDYVIDIVTAIIIFSQFADRLGLTPYLLIYGPIETGKGAILEIIHQLGYRVVSTTVPNASNIYRLLGDIEKGQVTIVIDEANRIDENAELLEVLKTGYKGSATVGRSHDSTSAENQQELHFFTYSLKILIAEHEPNWKAEGLKSRCLKIKTVPGVPKILINEVVENAGDPELAGLYKDLVHLRKLLFAYRLVHFSDPIPTLKLNITGRDRELSLPLVRLFREAKVLDTVKETLFEFVKQRKEARIDSFEAFVCTMVKGMLETTSEIGLEFADIWDKIKEQLNGEPVPERPRSISTALHGEISKKRLSNTLGNLGGKKAKDHHGNRVWTFNPKSIARFSTIYGNLLTSLEILPDGDDDESQDNDDRTPGQLDNPDNVGGERGSVQDGQDGSDEENNEEIEEEDVKNKQKVIETDHRIADDGVVKGGLSPKDCPDCPVVREGQEEKQKEDLHFSIEECIQKAMQDDWGNIKDHCTVRDLESQIMGADNTPYKTVADTADVICRLQREGKLKEIGHTGEPFKFILPSAPPPPPSSQEPEKL